MTPSFKKGVFPPLREKSLLDALALFFWGNLYDPQNEREEGSSPHLPIYLLFSHPSVVKTRQNVQKRQKKKEPYAKEQGAHVDRAVR